MGLPCAILTEKQVETIKRRIYDGDKLEDIAGSYKMSFKTISSIKRGINWPDVLWPTGKGGAIPKQRALEITRSRLKMRRSPEYQARVAATRERNAKSRKRASKKPNGSK